MTFGEYPVVLTRRLFVTLFECRASPASPLGSTSVVSAWLSTLELSGFEGLHS